MKQQNLTNANKEHFATAKATNLPLSTKQCIEISNTLRYKNTRYAKKYLEEVAELKRAVPFKRFIRDLGHKPGMAAGRFPQKAAKEFLKLIKSVEANAQAKGLNILNLKISKIMANKASIPVGGGRHRHGTKRTHLEIEVKERKESKQNKASTENKASTGKKEKTSSTVKDQKKSPEVKSSEIKSKNASKNTIEPKVEKLSEIEVAKEE